MTVEEFEQQRSDLVCRHCGQAGTLTYHRDANNHLRVACSCGPRFDPIGGAPYLSQGRPSTRKPLTRPGERLASVWSRFGDRCIGCGTHADDLARLGIGRHRQHAPPIAVTGDETATVLLPMCALCHEHVTANQRALSRLIQSLADTLAVPAHPNDTLLDMEPFDAPLP